MEQSIRDLDDKTDEATKVMLQKLVDKKQKYERYKRYHEIVLWITILSACYFFYYLYETIITPYGYSFAWMFSVFVQKSTHLNYLLFLIGGYGMMNLLLYKRDKAETEYHELRCEIIDKSDDLWGEKDAWQQRHLVFEMMKKKFDINLYYESK